MVRAREDEKRGGCANVHRSEGPGKACDGTDIVKGVVGLDGGSSLSQTLPRSKHTCAKATPVL